MPELPLKMSADFILPAIKPVQDALRLIDPQSRSRGEAYFNAGRVEVVEPAEGPGEFRAVVRGTQIYEVWIKVGPQSCTTECGCPLNDRCKHVYAALRALVVEHTAAQVRRLSATQVPPETAKPGKASRARSKEPPFPKQVAESLGRALNKEEREFMEGLTHLYEQYGAGGSMPAWYLRNIDVYLPNDFNQHIQLPGRAKSLRQFWLYLAHILSRRGQNIPPFLAGVTNLEEVAEDLREFERAERLRRWQTALLHAPVVSPGTTVQRLDLRAVVMENEFVLQARFGATFAEPKPMQLRDLQRQIDEAEVEISPEAEWLWETFDSQIRITQRASLSYSSLEHRRKISRILRMPAVQPFIVKPDGTPMQFISTPLRWKMEEPKSGDDDYEIELAQEDGSAVPEVICVLPGRPCLYLTREFIFRGPDPDATPLDPRTRNAIPAAALETRNGVTMLNVAGIELPPALRSRVEYVRLKLRISCKLASPYYGSDTEHCQVQFSTVMPNGQVHQVWSGTAWTQKSQMSGQRKGEPLAVLDGSGVPNPAQLITVLNGRWQGFEGYYTIRVSKKFPDAFVPWIKSMPSDVEVELHGELGSLLHAPVSGEVRLDVTETEIDWFDLRVVLNVSDTTLTQDELKLLLNARGGYVRLKEKGWRKLEFNLSEEENEHLARLGLSPSQLTGEPQRLHALQLADKSAKRFLKEEQFARVERRAAELKTRVTPDLPATISAELRPYQLEGYHFLAYLAENGFGGILADDMGLGKTVQTLTWLEWLRQQPARAKGAKTSLVVCPKSVMDNWRAEAERFAPALKVKVWHPENLDKMVSDAGSADLHVLNYNQLRMLGESLQKIDFLTVILDEGQFIKNPSSLSAQVARSLRARYRLVLSGTPIENRLMDLWSLMSFAMPGVLGSRHQFGKIYDTKDDPLARRRLSARVRPFLLRRTKAQVAKDLPERTEEDLYCELEGEQKTLYRAELKRAQQILLRLKTQKQLAQERFHVLTSLLRMRQICCHPKLVNADSKAESAKVEALMDQLEPLMEEGHKVLVFSQFVQMLDILQEAIKPQGWKTFYLAGETENRGDLVREFQATEGAAIFLISLKAGGFGLNLTAASYVVLFDPWWNPAVENQAIDRTHRIGQTRNVMAYRLLIKDSIEEKIRTLQRTKSSLAEDVLGEEKFSQSLTLDDLHFLFSDTPAVE